MSNRRHGSPSVSRDIATVQNAIGRIAALRRPFACCLLPLPRVR